MGDFVHQSLRDEYTYLDKASQQLYDRISQVRPEIKDGIHHRRITHEPFSSLTRGSHDECVYLQTSVVGNTC